MKKNIFLLTILSISILSISCKKNSDLTPVVINGITFNVEIADDREERAQGLMYRTSMKENRGMLFVYDEERILSFWMKNTRIPLSIAFIDKHFIITDIKDMEPYDRTSVPSSVEVLYALELNQGIFEKHNIKVGDKVYIKK